MVSSPGTTKARFIAFYLPQFHPIPENDLWWGRGFTEWRNVAKAKALYRGHYQPRIPADLGFYDLRLPEVRAAQAAMAQEYGLEGFCYWHYWFGDGERLLERPFNEVLRSGEPDFPFCLAWANESWTGIWHGAPDKVLKQQTYPGMHDHEAHFYTLLEAFTDRRYLTVDGRPIFAIFHPLRIPESKRVTDLWRELARKAGLKGLHLVAILEHGDYLCWNSSEHDYDAITLSHHSKVLQIPGGTLRERLRRKLLSKVAIRTFYRDRLQRPLSVYSYTEALPLFIQDGDLTDTYHPCVVPNWDNTPRSGRDGLVLHGSTPELFRIQVREAMKRVEAMPPEHRLIFVKSWNEWAEGNYLEPDTRYGKGYLEVIRDEVLG